MSNRVLLGTGQLGWPLGERVSDRYGLVHLDPQMQSCRSLVDKEGALRVRVVQTRNSSHIGDLFRKIGPTRPEVGEEFELGHGTFFMHEERDGGVLYVRVGVRPTDGREDAWMDPEKLYRAHDQTVELYFEAKE